MSRLLESLWHGPPLLGYMELKYDRHSKKYGEFFGKNDEVPEGGAKLWFWNIQEIPIRRGIFQEEALSPLLLVIMLIPLTHVLRPANPGYEFRTGETINHLLFMDDLKLYSKSEKALYFLIQTVRIFSEDIGMQFRIAKCVILVTKNGKIVKSDGIQLPNDKVIKSLEEGGSYENEEYDGQWNEE